MLVYCRDYRCSHHNALSADRWPHHVRLSDIEPDFVRTRCGKRGAEVRPKFSRARMGTGWCRVSPASLHRACRARPPSGPPWVHEIKHDSYRLMVRRDGLRVRCFSRNGHDWANRFPAIVEAAARLKAQSFLIDGEVVIARDDGTPDFNALRSKRRGHEAVLYAFDLIECTAARF